MAKELKPDAITLDVMMPDMDGWSVLSALKADNELADIPVIMLTMVDNREMGFALGASEYMTKPINRDRLITILKKHERDNLPSDVLVVEDNDTIRGMVRSMLEAERWTVTEAENGKIALEKVKELRPALILLDIMMPVMDGFDFVAELRNNPEWQDIPVVILTGKDLEAGELEALHGRVEKVLQKGSYSREELLRDVTNLVRASVHRQKAEQKTEAKP